MSSAEIHSNQNEDPTNLSNLRYVFGFVVKLFDYAVESRRNLPYKLGYTTKS